MNIGSIVTKFIFDEESGTVNIEVSEIALSVRQKIFKPTDLYC